MITTDDLNVMEGYVARDEHNSLWLYGWRPTKTDDGWCGDNSIISIPNEMFPNLKWEDEPIKVELTIKTI